MINNAYACIVITNNAHACKLKLDITKFVSNPEFISKGGSNCYSLARLCYYQAATYLSAPKI